MNKRVLLVGLGVRGRQWITAMRSHRTFQLAGTCDPDTATGATWADLDSALASAEKVEGVIVASPPHLHVEHSCAVLRAGYPVLVEKPMALSVSEASKIVDAARATGLPALVGHNYRFHAANLRASSLIASGKIGKVSRTVLISTRPRRNEASSLQPESPAEGLWDVGIHHLDLLIDQLGGAPDQVISESAASELGPSWTVKLIWDTGETALYRHSNGPQVFMFRQWIEGSEGALEVTDRSVTLLRPNTRPKRFRTFRERPAEHYVLDEFRNAIEGNPSVLEVGQNMQTMQTITRALEGQDL